MSCDQSHLLSAYLDGELPAAQATAVADHVAGCPTCAAEVDELRALGRLMTKARRSDLGAPSDDVMARLRVHVRDLVETADYGLLRIARIFSGLAATVLIAGLWLLHQAATPPNIQSRVQPIASLPSPPSVTEVLPTIDPAEATEPNTREAILEKLIGVDDPTVSSNRPVAGEEELP